MRTKHLSFQLEKDIPGLFILQGASAGMVAGLIYAAAMCLWHEHFEFTRALFISPYLFFVASFAGVFKSILMWVPYRLTKIKVRPAIRVMLTSIGTGVLAFVLAYKFGYGFERPTDTAAWVVTMLAGGLPTAMLVGSRVKPWEIFTFGSIAVGDSRTGGRVGSKSVLATLATLPLRLLSLLCLALWILAGACEYDPNQGVIRPAIVFFIPFIYLLYSAYVTFKSPHRVLLLVSCIALNLPVGFITCYAYIIAPGSYLFTEALPYVCGIGSAFLIAWAIFLVARLNVPIPKIIATSDSDHHCLGSRFMEWHENHA